MIVHRRTRPWAPRRTGGTDFVRVGLLFTGSVIGWRVLAETFTLFRQAYLHTAGATTAEWSALRFAFDATVLVAAGGGVCVSLLAMELGRLTRR